MRWVLAWLLCLGTAQAGITNIVAESGRAYVVTPFTMGMPAYIDRAYPYTYSDAPGWMAGHETIRTANDDKTSTSPTFLTLTLDEQVVVYVGYDVRLTTIPSWLQAWHATAFTVSTNDTSFRVFHKTFLPGTVVLGGNEGSGEESMYVVAIFPFQGTSAPAPPTITSIDIVSVN